MSSSVTHVLASLLAPNASPAIQSLVGVGALFTLMFGAACLIAWLVCRKEVRS